MNNWHKLAYVQWLDTSLDSRKGLTLDDIEPGIVVQSVGFVAKETRHSLSLAMDRCSELTDFREVENIPVEAVWRRRVLSTPTLARKGLQGIYVRWKDASHEDGSVDKERLRDKPVIVESAGIFIKEDRMFISIAQNHWMNNTHPWCWVMHIPKRFIVEQRRFKL